MEGIRGWFRGWSVHGVLPTLQSAAQRAQGYCLAGSAQLRIALHCTALQCNEDAWHRLGVAWHSASHATCKIDQCSDRAAACVLHSLSLRRRAFELYVAAAQRGHAAAQNALGQIYKRNIKGIADVNNRPDSERLAQVSAWCSHSLHLCRATAACNHAAYTTFSMYHASVQTSICDMHLRSMQHPTVMPPEGAAVASQPQWLVSYHSVLHRG